MPCCCLDAVLGRSGFSTARPVGAFCTPPARSPRDAGLSMLAHNPTDFLHSTSEKATRSRPVQATIQ
jgi:hypothetical protein